MNFKNYKTSYRNNNKYYEAHIENFKNVKGIAEAKGEIINNIENGTIILNRDDKFFKLFEK